MVKPRDSGPPQRGVHSDSAVSKLQRFLKDRLNLSFQLDEIDYSKPNFIHADLDAETFQQLQSERGESFATLMLSALMASHQLLQGFGVGLMVMSAAAGTAILTAGRR